MSIFTNRLLKLGIPCIIERFSVFYRSTQPTSTPHFIIKLTLNTSGIVLFFSELVVLDLEFFIFSDFTAHTFGEKLREDIFIAVVVFIARLCEIQGRVCC